MSPSLPRVRFSSLGALLAALAPILTLAAACGSGGGAGGGDTGPVLTPIKADILPIVISDDLAVGPSRVLVGLIKQDDQSQVLGADLHFRFFLLEGNEGTFKFEADATPLRITKTYTHTHADGTVETHEAGETGAYVANVTFDEIGVWGVEITGTAGGEQLEALRPTFSVNGDSSSPGIGEPAPRSVTKTLADAADIRDIDTSQDPIPAMHEMTIAQAVTSGRPSVIAFATPAFCVSQICGPAKGVFDDLYAEYGDRANFVDVEPYDVPRVRNNECPSLDACTVPATDEWGLRSEPWLFVVDAEGNVSAKFQGMASLEELRSALAAAVG